jgi:archaellum component FlaF (FlaF/FlaG flagellin family)
MRALDNNDSLLLSFPYVYGAPIQSLLVVFSTNTILISHLQESAKNLRQHAMIFALNFASFKDNIRVYIFIQTVLGDRAMSKEQFDVLFEHVFEEAVQESFQDAPPIPSITIKQSWVSILKNFDEQPKAN